jgi:hypothetical protein
MKEALARISARARSLAESVGQTHALNLRLPTTEAKHLLWFDDGTKRNGQQHQPKRPILTVDGRGREEMAAAIAARLRAGLADGADALPWLAAIMVGGKALRDVWLDRLDHNGADMRLAPLEPKYLARKVRKGLDPRTGIDTGAMRRAVAGALIVVSRKK